jgi:hypothetical protein
MSQTPDKQKVVGGAIISVESKKGKSPRVTVAAGGEPVSISLSEEDLRLFASCGYSVTDFQADHVFPDFARPYVRVIGNRIESVLDSSRGAYVNHKGDSVLEIPKPEVAGKKDSSPYDRLKVQFSALTAKKREGIPDDPECEGRADAIAFIEGFKYIHNDMQQNLGKMLMIGMWEMRSSGLYMRLPNTPRDIAEAMRVFDGQWNDMDYVIKLARVVDRILPEVEAARKRGTPFINPATKKPLTVEDLIMGDGLVKKLAAHSDHFSKLISPEDKQAFLAAIATKSNTEVAALKDKQQAITVASASETPVEVKQTAKDNGRYKIEMEVSEAQLHAIQRLLKPLVGSNWKI